MPIRSLITVFSDTKTGGNMKIKKSRGRIAFEIVNYTILALLALMCIFPFVHLLAVSFSADEFTSKGEVKPGIPFF